MTNLDWIINIFLFIIVAWFIMQRLIPAKGVRQMNTTDLKKIIGDKNRQYIDVRTPMEYRGNHIKGFKNIPVSDLRQRLTELSKDKEIIVICQSGMRSNKASKLLKKAGFNQVINIQGGMASWK